MSDVPWQFWIDVGGTFTDCLARSPSGEILRAKVLSSGVTKGVAGRHSTARRVVDASLFGAALDFWTGYRLSLLTADGSVEAESRVVEYHHGDRALELDPPLPRPPAQGEVFELRGDDEAPLVAIRRILGLPRSAPLPPLVVKLGTTRGTNALLTRRGARCVFVTTRGFGDILRIGYQNRPKLFELAICRRPPLFSEVLEIDERLTHEGEVLMPLDEAAVRRQLVELRTTGVDSLAVCLLNAYCQPRHEERIGAIAHEIGFQNVSLSHEVAPLIKLVARGDTTLVDAYLNPVLRSYVDRLAAGLATSPAAELRLLTSAGGLVASEHFTGKDSILSGPAGGVVGFARAAEACGFPRAIGFDMGGTSTDVTRYDGRFEYEQETEKAGVRIVAPMLAIHTVAAGGGSICRFDGTRLVVGPESGGAEPGPACYGRGGPLTVTDCNVFLGRVPTVEFPFPLQIFAPQARLDEVAVEIEQATGRAYDLAELAEGFLQVANANMVKAIRAVSVARGYDPRDYPLVAFGGAAGQHACAMARELGMRTVLIHPDAGLLSALGIGLADVVRQNSVGLYCPLDAETLALLPDRFAALARNAVAEVVAEGIDVARIDTVYSLDLRYRGLDASLEIARPADGDWAAAYASEHRRLYGYVQVNRPLEIVAARVVATGRSAIQLPRSERVAAREVKARTTLRAWFSGAWRETPRWRREELSPGDTFAGPAIVVDSAATTVVESGWRATVLGGGELLLEDVADCRSGLQTAMESRVGTTTSGSGEPSYRDASGSGEPSYNDAMDIVGEPDPVLLEVFHNQFAGIAEQMGLTLKNTASSVNVKERLDFSCAIFTAAGDLVVNAPHIPVHLGAMGETVRCLLADFPDLAPGDVLATNDPYRGGSHLPDVTVVTPIHDPASGELLFFTASRAHHAEIGGSVPGSMPPFSRTLAEEGVLIRGMKVVAAGQSRLEDLQAILLAPPYPTRNVADNLADISAQIAANQQGARELSALVERQGWPLVAAYMGHIQQAAERKVRAALAELPQGRHTFVDHLDDGSPIAVAVTIAGDAATFDFTGTGPVLAGNLNANRAIVTAAVMYVLRCLLDEEIPLNQGVLAPVRIVLPECLLNPTPGPTPEATPAVVGGNVETSQRVVDVLLGALGLAAASQGTMNNFLFGDAAFGYYETICGGSGATPHAPGTDAVHTHMTNTRLTDPEVLERRYPVRVRRFAIRCGSGGNGEQRGGDGAIREIEFLRPVRVSLLTSRRGAYAPYGLAGGESGAVGRNTLLRVDGSSAELPNAAQFDAHPGDVLRIETPGGGGWGVSSANFRIQSTV